MDVKGLSSAFKSEREKRGSGFKDDLVINRFTPDGLPIDTRHPALARLNLKVLLFQGVFEVFSWLVSGIAWEELVSSSVILCCYINVTYCIIILGP